jgi:hypothetical protein
VGGGNVASRRHDSSAGQPFAFFPQNLSKSETKKLYSANSIQSVLNGGCIIKLDRQTCGKMAELDCHARGKI